jgi:hypothetical protein
MRLAFAFPPACRTLLTSCVSAQEITLTSTAGEALRGRKATIGVRDVPDFAALTPGKRRRGLAANAGKPPVESQT